MVMSIILILIIIDAIFVIKYYDIKNIRILSISIDINYKFICWNQNIIT